ncbi:hypothetical protein V7S43_013698 [Phytophthora oleae]|uniref:Uncharacterized protein n=1 Tax=Phytophthora oleae TaxID=2107226 RepID=A0ABD3F6H1_9STRA
MRPLRTRRALPRGNLDAFNPAAVELVAPSDEEEEEAGASVDKEKLFAVTQELHDQLLGLQGDTGQVLATQEAISLDLLEAQLPWTSPLASDAAAAVFDCSQL